MQILRTAAVVAAALSTAAAQTPRVKRSELVLVKAVVDGDTIDVSQVGRVRLLGIDAPEISHGLDTPAPFGKEARERLDSLIWHRWVRLETEGDAVDVYNRRLAYVVTEDGQCMNTLLVREGLARVSARTPIARLEELKRAEAEAQVMRRGIWGSSPSIPSSGYTRRPRAPRSKGAKTKLPPAHPRKPKKKTTNPRP